MNALWISLLLPALQGAGDLGPARGPSLFLGRLDGDALPDLFVTGLAGGGRLLRNAGRGEFVDVTDVAGFAAPAARSGRWQDVDGDGDEDLLVLAEDGPLALWRNEGGGTLVDATEEAGLAGDEVDLEASFIDLDGDERVDLHRRGASGDRLYLNLGGRFELVELHLPGGASFPAGSGLGIECTKAVQDSANPGTCIAASTIPALGLLYPLSVNWFIDGLGRVGLGTTAPGSKLDVIGDLRASGQLVSTAASGAPLVVTSSTKVDNLNADRLDGLDSTQFTQLGGSIEGAEITDSTITAADLAPASVGASELIAGSVLNSALSIDSVTAEKIALNAVGSAEIASQAVGTQELASAAVTAVKIASDAVLTSHIVDAAVTAPKLAANAVTGVQVADGSLTGSDLAANSVDGSRLANGSISYSKLESPLDGSTSGAILWVENDITTTQGRGIYVQTSASGDPALEAIALDTGAGVTYGVQGLNSSAGGGGLWGRANHASGATFGVKGESASSAGKGVIGQSLATTGSGAFGVHGIAASSSGVGVYGEATASSGTTYGVWGETGSTSGDAVHGESTAASGSPSAVRGDALAPDARAIYGRHEASSGGGQGVRGYTASPSGYGVFSSGDLGASGAKSFVQPHPTDPSKELRFVCLEGNESGTYFRGKIVLAGGRAELAVPEDFRLASSSEDLSCQLTAVGAPALVWVESLDLERIVVRGSADVEVHCVVNGIRRGYAHFETIRANTTFVPATRGVPYGTQYPPEFRRILVDNGTLNPDFTPNVSLAQSLGWILREPGEGAE